jgi:hypothetical protein
MFHINDLLGKVVTIRSIAGNEFLGVLQAWNPEKGVLTVQKPLTVALDQDQVVLVPFAVTSSDPLVFFPSAGMVVMSTQTDVANTYLEHVNT